MLKLFHRYLSKFNNKRLMAWKKSSNKQPTVVPRPEHRISRKQLSKNVLKVLYRLSRSGFKAMVVGGGIRDIWLGEKPKDFDVVTDAKPREIRRLFRNSYLIGKRFPLVHVRFRGEVIEVSTFRKSAARLPYTKQSRACSKPVYGSSPADDYELRDFTLNAVYYDIKDFSLIDYAGGIKDLKQGVIRTIISAETSYKEDPIRMIRAIRFAAKLGFKLAPDAEAPIQRLAYLLREIAPARMFVETMKLFYTGCSEPAFLLLRQHGIWDILFPQTVGHLKAVEKDQSDQQGSALSFLLQAFHNTDQRFKHQQSISAAFLFAVVLWIPLHFSTKHSYARRQMESILREQNKIIGLPKYVVDQVKDIWQFQQKFQHEPVADESHRLMRHPSFKAAYDFLLLRAQSGEKIWYVAQKWVAFYEAFK